MNKFQVLIDTNAYAAFKRGHPPAVEILQCAQTIAINSIVLGELFAGFATGNQEAKNRQELEQFLATPCVLVLSPNLVTADYYATIYKQLKGKGRPIPTNDMWIAATALQHELALFSYDKHFAYIDSLWHGQQLEDFLPRLKPPE